MNKLVYILIAVFAAYLLWHVTAGPTANNLYQTSTVYDTARFDNATL